MVLKESVKVELKDAQKVKNYLIKNKYLDFEYKFSKLGDYIYYPISKNSKDIVNSDSFLSNKEFIKFDLEKKEKDKNFKSVLELFLSSDELSKVKTAFDSVGDIAILEIDESLRKKEKNIAEALLKTNPQIKTVLRKNGAHEGTFRTQKMKFLAGENKKETIHKENGVSLKLNVEEVYYSVRMSTERKRISRLVKQGEEILAMFCGCGPYPCVLGKNTKAKDIYGIELNPQGHKFGVENVKLNKLNNVYLINGDVNKVVPNFYNYIIGLKSGIKDKELNAILKINPKILEIHTEFDDLDINFEKLKSTIKKIQNKNIEVRVHQPIGNNFDIARFNINDSRYSKLISLIRDFNIKLTLHPSSDAPNNIELSSIIKNTLSFKRFYENIYFENSMKNRLCDVDEILEFIKKTKIKNFCFDISHYYYHSKNNSKIVTAINEIKKYCNTYFHVNDCFDNIDSKPLQDKSNVDFEHILPLVNLGVVEVREEDYSKPINNKNSFDYIRNFQKKFDRILMPLPKSAEDFLPAALKASKKGTVIHFYDFLHEDFFYQAHEKIDKACKEADIKYRIIETVKCGQHSPRTYRICVDFEIL
jgi:tRNA (guanine37-N1)-methyltransferase